MSAMESLTWLQLTAKLVGACVIAIVGVMKLPQIYSVWSKKSAKGLDLRSLVVEIAGLSMIAGYAHVSNMPISSFGEVFLLLIQDFILIWTVFYYKSMLDLKIVVSHILYFSYVLAIALGYVPFSIVQYLLILSLPGPYIGMTFQILTIRKAKSSGSLAPMTFFLGLFSISARVFTTAVETDDKIMLYNAICLVLMNLILTYHVIRYRDTTFVTKKAE